ncbi:HAD family hydrolase [Caulobacter sp. Root655]|uniref:TIGR01459 family HAD-type hydrolase n=1 Tax=Caulobacter sp. Root655 TaxID=1736578 RepID=UPI0006FFB225|nr:TIGR01459 family HAD-type hydrolase [Caulobacter sp. Root655]KRA61505.1 HAD family hydrolase [Caulobacter sp. Root655]
MTDLPAGLSALADRYDVLLCDVWGVIHNGVASFPEACQALVEWRAHHGPVILISNSPRPSADVVAQLDALGVPRAAWSAFVTSGDATRTLLAQRAPGPVWTVGPDRDAVLYEGLGLAFSGPEDAAFISVTGLFNDEAEGPEDYRERLATAAERGLALVCANPDRVVQRGDRLIYCGGALADLYEGLGGQVLMAGKPYAPIYDLALAEAEALKGGPVDRSRVLCIGDGVITDVKGAQDQGLACLFIAKGIHGEAALGPDGKLDPAKVEGLLAAESVGATHAMGDLVW